MVNMLFNKIIDENDKCVFYFYLKTGGTLRLTQYFFVRGVSESWTWMSNWITTVLCPLTCELKKQAICSWCSVLCLQGTGCLPSTPSFMEGKMADTSGYCSVAILQSFRQRLEGLIKSLTLKRLNSAIWRVSFVSLMLAPDCPCKDAPFTLFPLATFEVGVIDRHDLLGGPAAFDDCLLHCRVWSLFSFWSVSGFSFCFSSPQSFSHGFYGDIV